MANFFAICDFLLFLRLRCTTFCSYCCTILNTGTLEVVKKMQMEIGLWWNCC